MATIPDSLVRFIPDVEDALRAALTEGPSEILHACRYVMGWENADGSPALRATGKRIRPTLVLFGASLFAADARVGLPGAVAIELVHNFSLVHDEIQDHDMERHGRPTIFALMGDAQAINTGDFLYARAVNALVRAAAPAEARLAALEVLQDAVSRMIAGQWSDLTFESRNDVTADEYTAMIAGKTGAMLAAPIAMGALLAGAPRAVTAALREWGETIGLAFQVQDDYLGIWGEPDLTGKSNTNDIARKKKTLPIIHGLSTLAAPAIKAAYAMERPDDAAIASVVAALNEGGSAKFARDWAGQLAEKANQQLDGIAITPAQREALHEVGNYIVNRDA